MKTRASFVANSSSSSFVVRRKIWDSGILTTKAQDKKLDKFGFFLYPAAYPHQVPDTEDLSGQDFDSDHNSWCYSVLCNQYEVIEFLIKNKISFTANVHYDHEAYFYDAKKDVLAIVQNYGKQYSMVGGVLEEKEIFTAKPIVKISGKKYIKDNV